MMEFRDVDAPMDYRRIQVLRNAAGELLNGAHLDVREDEWVGARPCTADGLPSSVAPRARACSPPAAMACGASLGPVTGKLVSELITTERLPEALRAVSPLR